MVRDDLVAAVTVAANATGGWGYYTGKASRIEPTCWAVLALASEAANSGTALSPTHQHFLHRCQRSDGLLADRSDLPANLSWSALASVTLASISSPAAGARERLMNALVETEGVGGRNSSVIRQNNELKGWPWMPDTFSWAEPTSWCLLALKRARRSTPQARSDAIARRIAEGEDVLIDRACDSGGWNYGNSNAFGKNLPAHIPTTALGLIALQDKPHIEAVRRGLAFVEEHWKRELSGTALALACLSLRIYGRHTRDIESAITDQWRRTRFLGNIAAASMAYCALMPDSRAVAALTIRS